MDNHQRFTVTQEHINLLRNAYISWDTCEFGAPEIDPKRPYGNSYVYGDIAEILDIEPALPNDEDEFDDEQLSYMHKVHKETKTALQIFLSTGVMYPGNYIAKTYSTNWFLESSNLDEGTGGLG